MLVEHHAFALKNKFYVLNIEDMKAYKINRMLFEDIKNIGIDKTKSKFNIISVSLKDALNKMNLIKNDLDRFNGQGSSKPIIENTTHISLNVTQGCNLQCIYCYGEDGEYGKPGKLSEDIAFKSIDWLINNSGDSERLLVTFFGGEPLLNFPLIEKVVQYAQKKENEFSKKFYYSITTNGTLLNKKIINFLDENKFSVVISIDGDENIQNVNRPFKQKDKTHHTSVQRIKSFLSNRNGNALGRATIVKNNDNLFKVYHDLRNIGFDRIEIARAYSSECSSDNKPSNLSLSSKNEFSKSENDFWEYIAEQTIHDVNKNRRIKQRRLMGIVQRLASRKKKEFFCGVGKGLVGVSSQGDIYPCHRFVGDDRVRIGNINNSSQIIKDAVIKNNGINNSECLECWARYFCGGGCLYDNLDHNDLSYSKNQHWCKSIKKIVELGIYVYDSVDKRSLNNILKASKLKYNSSF